MKFPDSTYFNRKLPKQRFYENLTISAATKKSFVDQIKSIYWENKISADTINIAAENKVTEIEIFRINLNQDTIDESVLRLLDKGIPYPIIFILQYNGKSKLCVAYKEISSTGECHIVSQYYHTEWDLESNIELEISGLSIESVYHGFIRQIAGDRISENSSNIKYDIEISKQKDKLVIEIERAEKMAWKEKQPKKKFELADRIKKLKRQLESLEHEKIGG